jgi:hypothetical protein
METSTLTKKYVAGLLSVVVLVLGLTFPVSTSAQSLSDVEKTRSKVQTLSLNRDKKIEIKLRDKTNIKGYITAVEPDSFMVTDSKTAASQRISYSEVEDVKKVGGGFSPKMWLIIGGVAAGAITTWVLVKPAVCDGGAQTRGLC